MQRPAEQKVRTLIFTPIEADTERCTSALRSRFPDTVQVDAASDLDTARECIGTAEVLMAWKFPGHLFAGARSLRWIQKLGTGVEDLCQSPVPDGVTVTNMPDVFGPWVAEHCLAYMLASCKGIRVGLAQQARHEWRSYDTRLLRGSVLGVAGLGHIGMEVARLAKAFGMTVHGLRRQVRRASTASEVSPIDRLYAPEEKLDFLRNLDYLVLALPGTEETVGFLDAAEFRELHAGVTLINVGRGSAIVESELLAALHRGQIRDAALDVFATEPLPSESPLWDLPGVWVAPHLAGPVYVDQIPEVMISQMERYIKGEPLRHVVDLKRGY